VFRNYVPHVGVRVAINDFAVLVDTDKGGFQPGYLHCSVDVSVSHCHLIAA
jgi:hypothetical protein